MKEKKEKNPKSLKIGSLFAWQSRAVSHGICMMILGYLSIYCTDTLKMDPLSCWDASGIKQTT